MKREIIERRGSSNTKQKENQGVTNHRGIYGRFGGEDKDDHLDKENIDSNLEKG